MEGDACRVGGQAPTTLHPPFEKPPPRTSSDPLPKSGFGLVRTAHDSLLPGRPLAHSRRLPLHPFLSRQATADEELTGRSHWPSRAKVMEALRQAAITHGTSVHQPAASFGPAHVGHFRPREEKWRVQCGPRGQPSPPATATLTLRHRDLSAWVQLRKHREQPPVAPHVRSRAHTTPRKRLNVDKGWTVARYSERTYCVDLAGCSLKVLNTCNDKTV